MLYQKDTVNNVQTVYSCLFDVYSVENVTMGRSLLGQKPLSELIFVPPNTMTPVLAVIGLSQMTACTGKLDAQRETIAIIIPLAISPEQAGIIPDFTALPQRCSSPLYNNRTMPPQQWQLTPCSTYPLKPHCW